MMPTENEEDCIRITRVNRKSDFVDGTIKCGDIVLIDASQTSGRPSDHYVGPTLIDGYSQNLLYLTRPKDSTGKVEILYRVRSEDIKVTDRGVLKLTGWLDSEERESFFRLRPGYSKKGMI